MISPILPTYAPSDLTFERGEGAYLYTSEGKKYLDFAAGIAVVSLGHCHPALVEALRSQSEKLWHVSNIFRIPGQEKVARKLIDHSFADTVFFCNSGVEALEAAIKMARRYQARGAEPKRRRIVAFENSFHGRSLATIAASGQGKMLEGFDPLVTGFDHVRLNDIPALEQAVGPQTAAILIEPIQGEGGVHVVGDDVLRKVRTIADQNSALLICDEVQSGIGRSGKFFAHEWSGITPDIVTVAKGIGGGFPAGACLATEKAARGMDRGSHGSTFGGNPLAMAVVDAVLEEVLSLGFLAHVEKTGKHLRQRMEEMSVRFDGLFQGVRGRGLMLGWQCVGDNRAMIAAMREHGLLSVWAEDNVVRWLPPLIIDDSHVDHAMEIMEKVCARMTDNGG